MHTRSRCDLPEALRATARKRKALTSTSARRQCSSTCRTVAGRSSPVRSQASCTRSTRTDGEILWQTRVGKGGRAWRRAVGFGDRRHRVYVASLTSVWTCRCRNGSAHSRRSGAAVLDPAGRRTVRVRSETGKHLDDRPHPGCGDKPGCSPAQSAAVTAIPGVVFSGGLDGHLRAYCVATAKIIWDVDTARSTRP